MHPKVEAALTRANVKYAVKRHADFDRTIASPIDFAEALGYTRGRITKTVLLRSAKDGTLLMTVCSFEARIDLSTTSPLVSDLAERLGWDRSRLQVADLEALRERVGYPPTGVSPLGVESAIPIYVDRGLMDYETVLTGAGEARIEIEIAPADLVEAAHATVIPLTKG